MRDLFGRKAMPFEKIEALREQGGERLWVEGSEHGVCFVRFRVQN